jgi:LemA protein
MDVLILVLLMLFLIIIFGAGLMMIYNALIDLKMKVENAWAQIDVQLKRRIDLIPNLVETVKGYSMFERKVLNEVTEARASLMSAKTPKESARAENMLSSALKSIFAVAEAYPSLKANENFKALQEELSATENKVAFARQFYNDIVMSWNTKIKQFPTNIIAGLFNMNTEKDFFEATEEERKNVKVDFSSVSK